MASAMHLVLADEAATGSATAARAGVTVHGLEWVSSASWAEK